MGRDTLTGSRIRERRIARGLKQAELAREAGISASYLNLIEHNRRRIGGKLLNDISAVLGVEPSVLTEGAGAAMLASLREVAGAVPDAKAELDRVDEFAGRFPGWARLLADRTERIAALERMVEVLNDRMTHDPHLAASLHEMLTVVTAIRSTASILTDPGDVEPEWQARFLRNIVEDSVRLAEGSRSLVTFLEADGETVTETGSPQEEMDGVLDKVGHHIPALEQGGAVDAVLQELGQGISASAQSLLREWLLRYQRDAEALPLYQLRALLSACGPDTAALSAAGAGEPGRIMRRLAAMPEEILPEQVGLVICDGSGVLTYRKSLSDFVIPRVGAGCPLWPLYRALGRPNVLMRQPLRQAGRLGAGLLAEAVAIPRSEVVVNKEPIYHAQMLIRPQLTDATQAAIRDVGVTCRICPQSSCPERREPSVIASSMV